MKQIGLWTIVIIICGLVWAESEPGVWEFHVALNGVDSQDGTLERPFATLERAQKEVRRLTRKGLDRPVAVYLHDGEYLLDKPLTFKPEDGGNERFSVTYQAYPGCRPSVVGGREIRGWERKVGNVWVTALPDVKKGKWWFRQLFVDGKRLPRGRYPNGDGLLHIAKVNPEKTSIEFEERLPFDSLEGQNAEIIVIQNGRSLVPSYCSQVQRMLKQKIP